MSSNDHSFAERGSEQPEQDGRAPGSETADTASFQEFMERRPDAGTGDGRTFRMLTLLAGVVVLVLLMYLLLFS